MTGPVRGPVLWAVLACLALNGPPAAAVAGGGPLPLNLDVPVFVETFEGVFPGTAWTANDTNGLDGDDYWGPSNFRSASGNVSLWAAGTGSQLAVWDAGEVARVNASNATNTTVFFDDFEGGNFTGNWTAWDGYSTSGNDTWGPSTVRPYAGTTSVWSAQVGYNDELLDENVNVSSYDNYQWSYMARNVSLSNFSNSTIVLEYWWWLDSEQCCDYLYAAYYDGNFWNDLTFDSGQTAGWTYTSVEVPSEAVLVGFVFETDSSVLGEGAYIDNVSLTVAPPPPPAQPAGPFVEDFEPGAASGNWTAGDEDTEYGRDTWGISSARAHSGSTSLWCAQLGNNFEYGGAPNVNIGAYDDSMLSRASRPIVTANLSLFPSATFSFWYWLDSEQGFDYLSPVYYNQSAGWTALASWDGTSNGWVFATFTVPNDTEAIGFEFSSDVSVVYEGAYVDDIELLATRDDPNSLLRTYDTSSDTTLSRAVTLSPYAEAYLEYSYWLSTDSPNDTLEAMALAGTSWTTLDRRTGNSSAWQTLTFPLPLNATRIGFRFSADSEGHGEGAYLDDIRMWGVVYPINCTADVSALSGTEAVTPFAYSVVASSGLLPYRFAWDFSDGGTSLAAASSRTFVEAGNYTANLTITDALGQTCLAQAPTVTVGHDTHLILLSPPTGPVLEGQSLAVNATDARAHGLDFDWTLSPPECGALDVARGPSTIVRVSEDAGGLTCAVQASIASTSSNRTFAVLHDTTVVLLTPSQAELVEGQERALSGADRYGHPALLGWTASCGRVTPPSGPSTVFTADGLGGEACTVTAVSPMGSQAAAAVTVLHDTSSLTVAPSSASPLEGSDQLFAAVDVSGHPARATWSVEPATCGVFSDSPAAITTFTASPGAGGVTCTVTATVGPTTRTLEVAVGHDFAGSTIFPPTATLAEGAAQSFALRDGYGHPFDAQWDLAPPQCGALSAPVGPAVTLTVDPKAGVRSCTLRATGPRIILEVVLNATHGPPSAVHVQANVSAVLEGGFVSFEATVRDASGHTLSGFPAAWSATCGVLSVERGRTNSLVVALEAGGTECNVTASVEGVSGGVTFPVRHAPPFRLAVVSDNAPGAVETLTAEVRDRNGHLVPEAVITWKATCGSLSTGSGSTVTYTPPSDLAGSSCRVTATSLVGTAADEEARVVTTGISPVIPLGTLAAIAGVVGGLVIVRRRRRGAESAINQGAASRAQTYQGTATVAATAPGAAAGAPASGQSPWGPAPCPSCGEPVEVGWAACPVCGLGLEWG